MGQAYGFFEIPSVTAAVVAIDMMCKTAQVELVTWEKKLGGRLVTIIVRSDTGDRNRCRERDQRTGGIRGDRKSPRGDHQDGEPECQPGKLRRQ